MLVQLSPYNQCGTNSNSHLPRRCRRRLACARLHRRRAPAHPAPTWDNYCRETGTFVVDARPDVKPRHTYLLHNPFTNVTVPLPELDAIIGHVAETFEVRKVLLRSSTNPADDLVTVTTSSSDCNIILCRPGKGALLV